MKDVELEPYYSIFPTLSFSKAVSSLYQSLDYPKFLLNKSEAKKDDNHSTSQQLETFPYFQ
jgi:hypothetical protein